MLEPDVADVVFSVGYCRHSLGELPAAETAYRRAKVLDTGGTGALAGMVDRWLGKLLIQLDRPAEALPWLRPLAGSSPRIARIYATALARQLPERLRHSLGQESIVDRLDGTLRRIDAVPSDDISLLVVPGRIETHARAPAFLSGCAGRDRDFICPPYKRPPLYLACYHDAAILAGGLVLTSRDTIVSETIYAHGDNPPVGRVKTLHRKSWLKLRDGGGLSYGGPAADIEYHPYPVLSLVTSRKSYGAFLTTQLTRLCVRDCIGLEDLRVAVRPLSDFDSAGIMEHLGVPRDRIIDLHPAKVALCRQVLVSNYPIYEYNWIVKESIKPLLRIRDSILKGRPVARRRLYVSRVDTRTRYLQNEDEIFVALKAYGFEFIVPSKMTWEEKVEAFADAEIIVGANGSGLYNAVFSRLPNVHVVALFDGFDGPSTLFVVGELVTATMYYVRASGAWSAPAMGGRRTDGYVVDPSPVLVAVRQAVDSLRWDEPVAAG